jgi:PAS domain S-box-containing protein
MASLFRTIMDSLREVVLVRRRDGSLVYCSPSLSRLFGYAPEELASTEDALGLIHPDDLPAYLEATRACYEDGEEFDLEYRGRRRDGSYAWIQNRAYWADEHRSHLVGIFHEITDRKGAEAALRRAHDELEERVEERTAALEQATRDLEADIAARTRAEAQRDQLERELRRGQTLEAMGRLAGGVAHDVNNLLGSILGCLYAARTAAPADPAAVAAELDRIQELCRRGGELTRQLLTVAGRRPGHVESLDLPALLSEARVLLERTLPRDVRFTCSVEPNLPRVRADRSLLTAALLNLGLNARDAMPRGGHLTLSAARDEDGAALLCVSDTGPGIPEDLRERIFEPFFTTKAAEEGTGLGLAMVYTTVSECRGKIEVDSVPGRGATFRIRLPAEQPALGAPSGTTGERPLDHPLTDRAVLVVEDEQDVARMMTGALCRAGYRVLQAGSGLKALEAVRDHRETLGLVALDLMLPGLGGEEVFRLLRSLAPDLPVLFTTAREDRARALDPTAPVLPKPFGDEDLLGALARAVTSRAGDGPEHSRTGGTDARRWALRGRGTRPGWR